MVSDEPTLKELADSIRRGNYHGYTAANFYVSLSARPGRFGTTVHNAAFRHYDLPFIYTGLKSTDIEADMHLLRNEGFPGASISMPHKCHVIRFLDDLTTEAAAIESVNTVINENGRLVGHNTDLVGVRAATASIKHDDKVVILGGGAMQRTFSYGKPSTFLSMSLSRPALDHSVPDATVVINATPRGMPGIEAPYLWDQFPNCRLYIESVVNETSAQRMAVSSGIEVFPGLEIAFRQAFEQFRLYTGRPAPEAVMREAILVNE